MSNELEPNDLDLKINSLRYKYVFIFYVYQNLGRNQFLEQDPGMGGDLWNRLFSLV